jgi:hypothetical protein
MRTVFLVPLLTLTGCIEHRATVQHPTSSDPGQAWIGSTVRDGASTAPESVRSDALPQELVADAWREQVVTPTWADCQLLDRVTRRPWPAPVPVTRFLHPRWTQLGNVGSPREAAAWQVLERAQATVQSPRPWWDHFPCDLPASYLPVDFPAHAVGTLAYRPVLPHDPAALRAEAAAAGYVP